MIGPTKVVMVGGGVGVTTFWRIKIFFQYLFGNSSCPKLISVAVKNYLEKKNILICSESLSISFSSPYILHRKPSSTASSENICQFP